MPWMLAGDLVLIRENLRIVTGEGAGWVGIVMLRSVGLVDETA